MVEGEFLASLQDLVRDRLEGVAIEIAYSIDIEKHNDLDLVAVRLNGQDEIITAYMLKNDVQNKPYFELYDPQKYMAHIIGTISLTRFYLDDACTLRSIAFCIVQELLEALQAPKDCPVPSTKSPSL